MSDIVLATLNAKYIHASFGLRYLLANLGELRPRASLVEFTLDHRPLDMAERLLVLDPKVIALGVYVWNVAPTTELVAVLKQLRPDLPVVLGGPEVSHETAGQAIVQLADYVVTGEGDLVFAPLVRQLLAGERPAQRIVAAPVPDLAQVALPYDEYTDEDIAHRLVYVEASRGCPFTCEFCLSSLEIPVRQFPLEPFLSALERLLARGLRHFKFVDRTFNLNLAASRRILEFFLERLCPDLFLHFEMVPDRLPEGLRELIVRFPPGVLQFEIGVQTFRPDVAAAISRRQDYEKMAENFRFLREHTGVHVHADLIAGLPGETLESFAAGFDRMVALRPQEIQVGILKRLRGAPIARHTVECGMVYSPLPPYELLQNRLIGFDAMQRMRRFARFWDLIGNSGNFVATTLLVWSGGAVSPFAEFMSLSEWLFAREGKHHGISLARLMERVFEWLLAQGRVSPETAALALWEDFKRAGRAECPPFLKPHLPPVVLDDPKARREANRTTKRQQRHGGATESPDAVCADK